MFAFQEHPAKGPLGLGEEIFVLKFLAPAFRRLESFSRHQSRKQNLRSCSSHSPPRVAKKAMGSPSAEVAWVKGGQESASVNMARKSVV